MLANANPDVHNIIKVFSALGSRRMAIDRGLNMPKTTIKPRMRALIIVLGVVAGILVCGSFSRDLPGRFRAGPLAEAKSQVEDARKDAAERIETLERENADLGKQLELPKANLDRRAEEFAAAEQEGLLLWGDLGAALTSPS